MPNSNTSNNNTSAESTLIGFLAKARNKKVQKRIISLLSVVVLLVTLNQTKLIADTLQRIPMCGIAEHMHDEVCVNEAGEYICGLEEHAHTDACYQQRPTDIEGETVEAEALDADVQEEPVAETSLELSDEGEIAEPASTVDDEAVVSGDVEEIPAETVVELGEGEVTVDDTPLDTIAVMPTEGEASSPVFDFEGRDYVALSEILPVLPLQMEEVVDVLAVLDEDQETSPIIIEKVEQDYTIYVIERFAWTDIAVETAEGLKTITLVDGGTREEDLRLQTEEISVAAEETAEGAEVQSDGGSEEQTVGTAAESEEQTVAAPTEGEEEQTVAAPTEGEEEQTVAALTEGEEEQDGEGQSDEEATEEGTDDHTDGDEEGDTSVAVEGAEDEEQTVESAVEEETDESEVEDETEESKAEGDDAVDEVQEQQPQVVADGFHTVIDLSEVEALPLSLREIVGKMEVEQSVIEQNAVEPAVTEETDAPQPEVIEEQIAEDAQSFEADDERPLDAQAADGEPETLTTENIESVNVEPAAEEVVVELGEEQADDTVVAKAASDNTTVDYDNTVLSLTPVMDGETMTDYAIDVIADFDSTDIIVDGQYTITLLNGVNPWPAQSFSASTEYMNVSVTADAGAFPAGTTMEVSDVVDDETISGIADSVTGNFVEIERVHAVDISFKDAEEREIEPKIPISVIMTVKEQIEEDRETVVVHMDNEGEASVVETAPLEPEVATVTFTADAFSVYAVVVARKLETNVLASDGENYKIEVTYGPDAGIPDGAVLAVSEVTEDEEYRAQVEAGLAGNKMITLARFFDIKIMESAAEDAAEVHPAEAVEVRVWLDQAAETAEGEAPEEPLIPEEADAQANEEPADATTVELGEEGPAELSPEAEQVPEETDDHVITVGEPVACAAHFAGESTVDVMDAAEMEEAVVFMAEGFSVWGVVYTVDFYYGNYEWHMDGEGEVLLSALFELLHIEEDPAAVADVQFTNPELLAVEKVEADWKLTSLAPFDTEEALTVTMDGGAVYLVRVEDAQYKFHMITNKTAQGTDPAYFIRAYEASTNLGPSVTKDAVYVSADGVYKADTRYNTALLNNGVDYEFAYWLKDDDTAPDSQNTTVDGVTSRWLRTDKIILDRDTTCIAWFAPKNEYIVRLKWPDGGGSVGHLAGQIDPHWVTTNTNNNASFPYYYSSEEVTLTATPESGKLFAGWYNGNELISTEREYPVSQATKHLVLKPVFKDAYKAGIVSNGWNAEVQQYIGYFTSGYEDYVVQMNNLSTTVLDNEGCTRLDHDIVPNALVNNVFIGWMQDDGTVPDTVLDNGTLTTETRLYRDTTFVGFFGPDGSKVVRVLPPTNGGGNITAPSIRSLTMDGAPLYYKYSSDDSTLTAQPDSGNGYMFTGWYLDGKPISHDVAFNVLNDLPADAPNVSTLEARFSQYKTFDVKVTVDAADGVNSTNVGYLTSEYFPGEVTAYSSLQAPNEAGKSGTLLYPIVPNVNADAEQKGYRFSQWVRQDKTNVIFTLNSVDKTTGALKTETTVADTDARFIAVFAKGYFIRVKEAQLRVNTASGKVESKTLSEWSDAEKTQYGITEFGGYTTEYGSLRTGNNDLFGWSYAYSMDGELTLVAQPRDGYEFVGWFNFTEMVSNSPRYMVKDAKYDMTLVPVFAKASNNLLVWFDGTNGLEGGEEPYDTFYTRKNSSGEPDGATRVLWNDGNILKPAQGQSVEVTLPDTATQPQNNWATSYELKGWYNIYPGTTTEDKRYFAPGEKVHVTDNTVFYADWFRVDYNVGVEDGHVIDPVDTSSFIHTYMFDYNNLFNMNTDSIVLNTDRSQISTAINYEYWDMKNHVGVGDPLNFVFMTTVSGFGRSMNPAGRDDYNQNRETTTNGTYYSGIVADGILLRSGLKEKIFGHSDALGKRFVGEGKNLYQYDPNTGYFYYDSDKNAASFHDGQDKFFLYDYTNATNKSDAGDRTDFLPFNYGQRTFREGYGEVNYWFGMESNIDFFLPNAPGFQDARGTYGNRATNGEEMVFKFAGDDDVWVYVDGQLVLDMGGVHGKVYGEINFSENTWTIASNGAKKKDHSNTIDYEVTGTDQLSTGTITGTLPGFGEGQHKLTIYYLERGSSQSNCAIYFNIAPLYTLKLRKRDAEDINKNLSGAVFEVYTDEACTQLADVFNTYYNVGGRYVPFTDPSVSSRARTRNFISGNDGVTHISGFYAGRTYYIKEISAPSGYPDVSSQVIKLTFDSVGNVSVDGSLSNAMPGVTSQHFGYDDKVSGSELFVPNTTNTALMVQKVWRDAEGHSVPAPENAEVTLELRRYKLVDQQSQPNVKYKVQINVNYLLDGEGMSVFASQDARQIKKAYALTYEVGYRQSLSFTMTANHNHQHNLALMTASGVYAANEAEIVYSEKSFGIGNVTKPLPVSAELTTGPVTHDTSVFLYFIGDVGTPPGIEDYVMLSEPTFTDNSGETWGRVNDELVDTKTLPVNDTGAPWKYTWANLPPMDTTDNNNKYYYYVKETSVKIDGVDKTDFYTDMYSSTGLGDGGTITVTNADETVRLRMLKQNAEVNGEGDHDPLEGARFKLYLSYHGAGQTSNILFTPKDGYFPDTSFKPVDAEYTSQAATGMFYDGYLPMGRYWLVETAAPSGFNMLSGPVEIIVESDRVKYKLPGDTSYRTRALTDGAGDDEPIVISIDNTPGYALPSTGGPGTTFCYVLGSLLTLLAAVLLLRRKHDY